MTPQPKTEGENPKGTVMENQQQREAEEQILSEAFDLVHEIAIGSDKDWENAYKTLAVRREQKLQAYQRAVEEMKQEIIESFGSHAIRARLVEIFEKHFRGLQ